MKTRRYLSIRTKPYLHTNLSKHSEADLFGRSLSILQKGMTSDTKQITQNFTTKKKI